ncbi:MAG: kelch repeat-containing protein [Chitinophagales bacterium]
MKKAILIILLNLSIHPAHAQGGEWTWMKGSNSAGSFGNFGTLGVSASSNTPPALYSPFSWTDLNGIFWLYGGLRYSYGNDAYAALWKFEPDSNVWTWVNGPSTFNQNPVYGTIGIPSPANQPGSRGFAGQSWVDLQGNLWLYGGASINNLLSDFWKYNLATGEWTCMGNYPLQQIHGDLGIGTAFTSPGARSETTAAWTDDTGDLWFYGGLGFNGTCADVWKYEMNTGMWIWMQGDSLQTLMGKPPQYGPQGMFGSNYFPGGRLEYCHWKDVNGKFWIFGGGNSSFHNYADLWQFDPALNQWAWMGGDTVDYYQGSYTATCDSISKPRCSSENRVVWVDATGNVWKMSGTATGSYNATNDLCILNPAQQEWIWVIGTTTLNASAVYGTLGIPDPANVPAGRFGSVGWVDQNGYLWVFGGRNNLIKDFNDLWRYVSDSSCVAFNTDEANMLPSFSSSDTAVCEKFCVSFFDSSGNNPIGWQWLFPSGSPASSILQNPDNICYYNPGMYDVTLITTSAGGNDTLTLVNYITVFETPPFPVITQAGYSLATSPGNSYQWQLNSADILGATNQTYTVLQSGVYTVIVGDSNGCYNSSSTDVLISGITEVNSDNDFSISLNPSDGNFTITFLGETGGNKVSINVMNSIGQIVFSFQQNAIPDNWKAEVHLNNISQGVYILEVKTNMNFVRKKILITN